MTGPVRVVDGLRPAVVIEGSEPQRWSLDERMAHHGVPGVAIAVIHDGEVAWAEGYGRCHADGPAVTPHTLFQAASISKMVAALVVLSLSERGHIDLDADVADVLAGWHPPPDDAGRSVRGVTPRRLLSHTAGTDVAGFLGYDVDEPLPTTLQILTGEEPCRSEAVRVVSAPGTEFRYSGGGTTVLELLVEEVTGTTFADAAAELVFDPIGMYDSSFAQPLRSDVLSTAAHGHLITGTPVPGAMRVYPEHAAAGLWSTASDLARLVLTVQEVLAGERHCVIGAHTAAMMLTPVGLGPHGLGPQVVGTGDARRFRHNGTNAGYCGQFDGSVSHRSGSVILTNGDGGNVVLGEITRSIADEYGWPGDHTRIVRSTDVDADDLDRLAGSYLTSFGAAIELVHDGRRLWSPAPTGRRLLVAVGPLSFVDLETGASVVFSTGDGSVTAQVLVDDSPIMSMTRSE